MDEGWHAREVPQKEEIEEIHHEASKLLMQKDQHIAELTKRLNDIQYHPDILNDDEVVQIMAKLSQNLDVWLEPVDVPYSMGIINKLQNMHHNWAFIRAFVTSYLFYYFSDVYMVGVRNPDIEYSLITMESDIFGKCPGYVADNWRSATGMGIQSVTKGYLDDAAMNCMRGTEQLGSCASADPGLREKKLYELFQSCVDFGIATSSSTLRQSGLR
ncbi:uncharacterized protein P174DRAFT_426282 [Aspergillus novofumigatus IBT 16806]|uniref:Uncharacterized protein n=1 Tax=Aspergillus novofumigatus (strain IBT 16806) TaxID=1392255 RepID=A0A2I1CJY9_ASPN1|nr:uncharacterized protein P174DRAFT_426282 [Aspergillus novofumigatus IBT 16806]PKX97928.1 hypothetical protein P174DRAFT_426282 [Aspergillus novofumigatus IBT 16806]